LYAFGWRSSRRGSITLLPRVNVNAIELMPVTQAFGPLAVHREDRPA
jgi:hypothetical protein